MFPRRALVVDDDTLVRQYVRDILLGDGWEVTEAVDGVDAMNHFRAGAFGVVVLDMIMPRMGGGETLRAIRAIDGNVGVLVVSGYAAPGAIQSALALGRVGFLPKPFRTRELVAAVEDVVGGTIPPPTE